MSCQRCGKCCRDFTIKLDVGTDSQQELEGFKRYLNLHGCKTFIEEKVLNILAPVMCENLGFKEGEGYCCKDYENRPEICRKFLCEKAMAVPETLGINVGESIKTKESTRA
jgi:Fe-S-cluster containining protein